MSRLTLGEVRRSAGFSQEALARKADIPLVSIQKWESGTRVPTIVSVQKLAGVLGDDVFHCEYGNKAKLDKKEI
jgi:transcriptional regulator with XRE-family HTH domain